eukprot:15450922-Alexandrium_andersonii.AAC.1
MKNINAMNFDAPAASPAPSVPGRVLRRLQRRPRSRSSSAALRTSGGGLQLPVQRGRGVLAPLLRRGP